VKKRWVKKTKKRLSFEKFPREISSGNKYSEKVKGKRGVRETAYLKRKKEQVKEK